MIDRETNQDVRNLDTSSETSAGPIRTVLGLAGSMIAYGIGLKIFRGVSFRANLAAGQLTSGIARRGSFADRLASKVSEVVTTGAKAGKYTPAEMEAVQKSRQWYQKLRANTARTLQYLGAQDLTLRRAVGTESLAERQYFIKGTADKIAGRLSIETERARAAGIRMKTPELTEAGELKDIRFTSLIRNTKKFRDSNVGRYVEDIRGNKYLKPGRDLLATAQTKDGRWGGKDFNKAMMSRLYRFGSDFASSAPLFYASYRMTAADDKKWYQPSAVAEWAGWAIGTDAVFRGAMPAASFVGRKLKGGIIDSFKGSIRPDMVQKSLSFLEKISKITPTATITNAMTTTHSALGEVGVKDLPRYMSTFASNYNKWSRILSKDPKRYSSNPLEKAITQLKNMQKKKGGQTFPKAEMLNHLEEQFGRKPGASMQFFNSMIEDGGLESATRKISPADVYGAINKSVIVRSGDGILSYRGNEYDLSNIVPKRLFREAARTMTQFSIAGLKPFGWFGLRPIFNTEQPFVYRKKYNGDSERNLIHIGAGFNPDNPDPLMIGNRIDRDISILKAARKKSKSPSKGTSGAVEESYYSPEHYASYDQHAFIDTLAEKRMLNLSSPAGEKFKGDLRRGFIKLEDGEEFLMMGDKAYYSIQNPEGGLPKVFRMGFDSKRGTFHRFNRYSQSMGGEMASVVNQHFGKELYYSNDKGNVVRSAGPTVHHLRPKVDPELSNTSNLLRKVTDKLELGSKEELSIETMIGQYMNGRYMDPGNWRVYASDDFLFNPNFVKASIKKDLPRHLGKLHNATRQMETVMTQRVMKNQKIMQVINSSMREDNSLGKQLLEMKIDPTDDMTTISKKTKMFSDTFGKRDNMDPELKSVVNSLSGTDNDRFLQMQSGIYRKSGKFRMSKLDAYNNSVYRNWLNANEYANLNKVSDKLITDGVIGRHSKLHRTLEMSRVIGEFDKIDIDSDSIKELDARAGQELLGRAVGLFRKNRPVIDELSRTVEPSWMPWMSNHSMARAANDYQGIDVLVSKNIDDSGKRIMNYFEEIVPHSMRTIADIPDPLTMKGVQSLMTVNAINNVGNVVGIGFSRNTATSVQSFLQSTLTKRILPAAAFGIAWQTADTIADESGLFEGTALGEGLNVFMADQIARSRLAIAGINDMVGVTDTARYLEDLMPGSITSGMSGMMRGFGFPVAGTSLGMARGGPRGAMLGGALGGVLSLMTAGGPLATVQQFDITKSRKELIEEYAGRRDVPVYSGAGWLFGGGAIGGNRINHYQPNWYHRLRSQYLNTDVLYGDKRERLLASFDPFHYYEKHQYTRPYPVKSVAGRDIPLVGNVIGSFPKMASEEDLKWGALASSIDSDTSYQTVPFGGQPSIYGNERPWGGSLMSGSGIPLGMEAAPTPPAIMPGSFPARANAAFQAMSEFTGLRGFMAQEVITGLNNGMYPYETTPILASADWMTSPTRMFWEQNWGDMLGMSEMLRRYVPKKGQHTNEWNQMSNLMPRWLPSDDGFINFQTGDPYDKIKRGEARLPGPGYTAMRDVKFNFPFEAEFVGLSPGEQIGILTGQKLPTAPDDRYDRILSGKIAQEVGKNLSQINASIKVGQPYFNPFLNLSGKADIVIDGKFLKVKAVSHDTFTNLTSPLPQHGSELNAILGIAKGRIGGLLYVDAETGESKSFDTIYNPEKFKRDMTSLETAKSISEELIAKQGPSIGVDMGQAYSRVDRLRILGDVAPFSDEYREALRQVYTLKKVGQLDARDLEILNTTLAQVETRSNRYLYTERKFDRGTPVTSTEKQYQDAIKAQYSPLERTVGSGWEAFCFSSRTGIITNNGQKRIEDIVIGDKVISMDGKLHNVNAISKRPLDKNDKLFSIKCVGSNSRVLVTGGHSVLAAKNLMCTCKMGKGVALKHRFAWSCDNCKEKFKIEYYAVDELVPGDLAALRLLDQRTIGNTFDLKILDINDELVEIDGKLYTSMRPKSCKIPIPRYINSKDDIALLYRFFGYFAAEGSTSSQGKIGFTLNINEEETLGKEITDIASGVLGVNHEHIKYSKRRRGKKTLDISICSKVLHILMKGFGTKTGKRIPTDIIPREDLYVNNLLSGIIRGDGWISEDKDRFSIGLCSGILAYEVRCLLAYISIASEYTITHCSTFRKKDGTARIKCQTRIGKREDILILSSIVNNPSIILKGSGRSHRGICIVDNYILSPIKEMCINTTEKDNLYDLNVDECHSYSLNMWTVHNSHLRTPLHSRFLNTYDPIEQYERNEVYGKNIRMWGNPYRDFIRPYVSSAMSIDEPLQGAVSWGTGGFVLGGPIGGAIGLGAGAIWGAANPTPGIPDYRQKERNAINTLDRIQYEKAKQAYALTGSEEALKQMKRTMSWSYPNAVNGLQLRAGLPRPEKAFVKRFMESGTVEERERIMNLVPDYMKPMLTNAWMGGRISDVRNLAPEAPAVPGERWIGWSPEFKTEDIAVKVFNREGWDAHDIGMGWQSQIRKMAFTPGIPGTFAEKAPAPRIDASEYVAAIQAVVPGADVQAIATYGSGININIRAIIKDEEAMTNNVLVRYALG